MDDNLWRKYIDMLKQYVTDSKNLWVRGFDPLYNNQDILVARLPILTHDEGIDALLAFCFCFKDVLYTDNDVTAELIKTYQKLGALYPISGPQSKSITVDDLARQFPNVPVTLWALKELLGCKPPYRISGEKDIDIFINTRNAIITATFESNEMVQSLLDIFKSTKQLKKRSEVLPLELVSSKERYLRALQNLLSAVPGVKDQNYMQFREQPLSREWIAKLDSLKYQVEVLERKALAKLESYKDYPRVPEWIRLIISRELRFTLPPPKEYIETDADDTDEEEAEEEYVPRQFGFNSLVFQKCWRILVPDIHMVKIGRAVEKPSSVPVEI